MLKPLIVKGFIAVSAALSLQACGIHYGRGLADELAPTQPRIASGQMSGANGQTVQGLISIYGASGSTSYILRAEGLTLPSDNTLQFRVYVQGGTYVSITPLFSGTKNYYFNAARDSEFTSVTLYSTAAIAAYGTATLLPD